MQTTKKKAMPYSQYVFSCFAQKQKIALTRLEVFSCLETSRPVILRQSGTMNLSKTATLTIPL